MKRKGKILIPMGAVLLVLGIAVHVIAEALKPTTERVLLGGRVLTPAAYTVWSIVAWSAVALGALMAVLGLVRYATTGGGSAGSQPPSDSHGAERDVRVVPPPVPAREAVATVSRMMPALQDHSDVAKLTSGARATAKPRRHRRLYLALLVALVATVAGGGFLLERERSQAAHGSIVQTKTPPPALRVLLGEFYEGKFALAIFKFPGRSPIEPTSAVATVADANSRLDKLVWTGWGAASSQATGVEVYNDCEPYCASGHFHTRRGARATASRIVLGICHNRPTAFYTRLLLHTPEASDETFHLGPTCDGKPWRAATPTERSEITGLLKADLVADVRDTARVVSFRVSLVHPGWAYAFLEIPNELGSSALLHATTPAHWKIVSEGELRSCNNRTLYNIGEELGWPCTPA